MPFAYTGSAAPCARSFSPTLHKSDRPYNTLKLEQRIDRCHRLGQENDVLSLAFINRDNLSDVLKLELASKRTLVSDGVFDLTDSVLGGFTGDLKAGFSDAETRLCHKTQVEADYQETLVCNEEENRRAFSAAEDMLFTTFTRELARRVNLSPRHVSRRAEELNAALRALAKSFLLSYSEKNSEFWRRREQRISLICEPRNS